MVRYSFCFYNSSLLNVEESFFLASSEFSNTLIKSSPEFEDSIVILSSIEDIKIFKYCKLTLLCNIDSLFLAKKLDEKENLL